jgi:hypothetical protein
MSPNISRVGLGNPFNSRFSLGSTVICRAKNPPINGMHGGEAEEIKRKEAEKAQLTSSPRMVLGSHPENHRERLPRPLWVHCLLRMMFSTRSFMESHIWIRCRQMSPERLCTWCKGQAMRIFLPTGFFSLTFLQANL